MNLSRSILALMTIVALGGCYYDPHPPGWRHGWHRGYYGHRSGWYDENGGWRGDYRRGGWNR